MNVICIDENGGKDPWIVVAPRTCEFDDARTLFFLLSDRGPVGEIVEADSQCECE